MASIFDVANWFLAKEKMTHKKLQKLCYYAQAWSLAIGPQPISTAEFEAWVHGPVCRELYTKYKEYGFDYIPKNPPVDLFTLEEESLLESVWETYGDMSANGLEALSHSEPPWKKARLGYAPNENCSVMISHSDMAEYYRSIYAGGDA